MFCFLPFFLSFFALLCFALLCLISPLGQPDASASQNYMALILRYLQHVQRENVAAVNEALNQLYIEEDNYEALRDSVMNHDQFDQIALAKQLEKHVLIFFRRISAQLYKVWMLASFVHVGCYIVSRLSFLLSP